VVFHLPTQPNQELLLLDHHPDRLEPLRLVSVANHGDPFQVREQLAPYRPLIQSEIKPFRGLLVSFFFISVGLSLDLGALIRLWPAVIGIAALLLVVEILTNAAGLSRARLRKPALSAR
jgi:Sodium/hydrogen exchanger family